MFDKGYQIEKHIDREAERARKKHKQTCAKNKLKRKRKKR